jgi:flagellar biosynthesis protein FlhG
VPEYPGRWMMDLSHPGWRKFWIDETLREVIDGNWDGAFADDALTNVSVRSVDQGYVECLRNLRSAHPEFIGAGAQALQGRYIGVVVNQTRDQSDMDIGRSMEHICQRYFGFTTRAIGNLNYDEAVWKSLKNRRLLVQDFPHSLIAKRLAAMASQTVKLLGLQGG